MTDRSQLLLDARLSNFAALLDISCEGDGLDVLQTEVVVIAPIEEAFFTARVRHPRVAARMVAVKTSMKRRPARSLCAALAAGNISSPARTKRWAAV